MRAMLPYISSTGATALSCAHRAMSRVAQPRAWGDGALCDASALRETGVLGVAIFLFVCVLFLVHGLGVFGIAGAFKLDLDAASVASQANVGGSTSALALARSLGRPDLVLPAILVGSLGTAIGTFFGIFTLERLL